MSVAVASAPAFAETNHYSKAAPVVQPELSALPTPDITPETSF